jgi:hypothetical protein
LPEILGYLNAEFLREMARVDENVKSEEGCGMRGVGVPASYLKVFSSL